MPLAPEYLQTPGTETINNLVVDPVATEQLRSKELLSRHYDVIVVGAGPGGAAAAGALAREGFRVLLLDRQPPGRDKTCGDAVSSRGVELLDKLLGLKVNTSNPPPHRINGLHIIAPNGKNLRIELSSLDETVEYPDITWPRAELDHAIFNQAMQLPDRAAENRQQPNQGSIHFAQVSVRGLLHDEVTGELLGIQGVQNGEKVQCYADYIIGADGASSAIARAVNFDPGEKAIAIRAYGKIGSGESDDERTKRETLASNLLKLLEDYNPHDIILEYIENLAPAYRWIFFLSLTEFNVGLGVFNQAALRELQKKLGVHKNILQYVMNQFCDELYQKYGIVVDPETMQVWSIPVWLKRRNVMFENGRVILIGDAAADTDPLTAGGIDPALEGANIVVQVLKAVRDQGLDEAAARKMLETLREELINQKMEGRLKAQRDIASNPKLLNFLFNVGVVLPKFAQRWLLRLLAGAHVS